MSIPARDVETARGRSVVEERVDKSTKYSSYIADDAINGLEHRALFKLLCKVSPNEAFLVAVRYANMPVVAQSDEAKAANPYTADGHVKKLHTQLNKLLSDTKPGSPAAPARLVVSADLVHSIEVAVLYRITHARFHELTPGEVCLRYVAGPVGGTLTSSPLATDAEGVVMDTPVFNANTQVAPSVRDGEIIPPLLLHNGSKVGEVTAAAVSMGPVRFLFELGRLIHWLCARSAPPYAVLISSDAKHDAARKFLKSRGLELEVQAAAHGEPVCILDGKQLALDVHSMLAAAIDPLFEHNACEKTLAALPGTIATLLVVVGSIIIAVVVFAAFLPLCIVGTVTAGSKRKSKQQQAVSRITGKE